MASMSTAPVPDRVNMAYFQQAPVGRRLSVGGTFTEAGNGQFTTTDGGILSIQPDPELIKEVTTGLPKGFVEVLGTKEGEGNFRASTILCHEGQVDVELWDEAVKMAHMPQLRALFEPPTV